MKSILLTILLLVSTSAASDSLELASQAEFRELLESLATAWNEGDADTAAHCFTPDAVYTEPPQKQVYRGRDELFEFFGGTAGRPGQMAMTWRTMVFDARSQTGMGEFSFEYGSLVHGVAVISLKGGLISQWREYWYESEKPWKEFVQPSDPDFQQSGPALDGTH